MAIPNAEDFKDDEPEFRTASFEELPTCDFYCSRCEAFINTGKSPGPCPRCFTEFRPSGHSGDE